MPQGSQLQLLVKTTPGLPGAKLQIDRAKLRFEAAPLFKSIGTRRGGLAARPTANWYVLSPAADAGLTDPAEIGNAWDICHELVRTGTGVAGGAVAFAEPD